MFRCDNSARHQGPTMAAGLFKNGLKSVLVLHVAAMTSEIFLEIYLNLPWC